MRVKDWREHLERYIQAARSRTFEYGSYDCALFAAGAVEVVTGIDYAAPLRGYQSRFEAYRIVAAFGSLEAMVTSLLGFEPGHPSTAMCGDVVIGHVELSSGETGECIGSCLGNSCAFPQLVGVRFLPRSVATRAWRIQ